MASARPAHGAGSAIPSLLAGGGPDLGRGDRDDYAVLNQGQLKYVAKLFYDRLADFGYSGPPLSGGALYPWTHGSAPEATADDDSYAAVNLGQLKHVFSFVPAAVAPVGDLYTADFDGDGIPNGWEIEHDLDPDDASDASIVVGGHTNLEIYLQSLTTGGDPLQANTLGFAVYSP